VVGSISELTSIIGGFMGDVTTEMIFAAIKQAVKEGIIKGGNEVTIEEYERRVAAWKRVVSAAIDAK
jgi:hypothetical protein